MTSTRTALDADWLGACRRAVAGLERLLAETPDVEDRARETGTRGSGGDRTLVIDSAAEEIVFAELDRLSADGYRFCALSEERGVIDYGDPGVRVIIDPIDGSLNAKRGALHYAVSLAVADGETVADVVFGFVHDFGAGEQWWATRGAGAFRTASQLDPIVDRATVARRAAGATGDRIVGPALGGEVDRRADRPRRTACGRWGRSRARCARSQPRGSTGWSRSPAAAASTRRPAS